MNIIILMSDIKIVYSVTSTYVQFIDDFKIDASGTSDPDSQTTD